MQLGFTLGMWQAHIRIPGSPSGGIQHHNDMRQGKGPDIENVLFHACCATYANTAVPYLQACCLPNQRPTYM